MITSQLSHAVTKVVEVSPVDESILMVYIKDGEIHYKDDGTGSSAYAGHEYSEGDDKLVRFGEALDTAEVVKPQNWSLTSTDDSTYSRVDGSRHSPLKVCRKAKVMNTDVHWNYALDHWIFLFLPSPLQDGKKYTLQIDPGTRAGVEKVTFTYSLNHSRSEAIHVNLLGYTPGSPIKAADLYLWLGDGGQRDYSGFEGRTVWIYDINKDIRHDVGKVTFWKKGSDNDVTDHNLTGSDVWNVDFSDFSRPGHYRLVVDGIGCSADFEIREDLWNQPFKTSLRGYYYMRIGERKEAAWPPPRQPRFIPGEDPEGFTIYLTDLHPFDKAWQEHKGDTWDEPHFKPARDSMFWQRRLPGNPTNPDARGGHADALDWDRHLAHVSNIYDLLLPYILLDGKIDDDDCGIPESGNGLPDLIDEARNEVDFWLSLRVGEAYAHGLTNPSEEKTIMFQAGATTMAAWANAANCAIMADALRIAGKSDLKEYYLDEAIKAFKFAGSQDEDQLDDRQEVGDVTMRGRDFRMMAAAFIYNVTGDTSWEKIMAEESVVDNDCSFIEHPEREWLQTWGTAAYLFSPQPIHYPELRENMHHSVRHQAERNNLKPANQRPSRRSTTNNRWQTPHNLHLVILAHALGIDQAEKERMERAMILEADWGLGRNPANIVEMTGLGSRCIVGCYTSGRNDGAPGLHPGHTPYNNLGSWGGQHLGSHPHWFTDRGYPDWKKGGWPHQEGFFNSRYSWANAEFTPRQTMRGKMALYSYLHGLNKTPPPVETGG